MYETKPYDNNEDEIRKMTKEADKNTKNRNGAKRITTQSKSSNNFATLRIKTIFEMINLHTVNELNLQMSGCVNVCEPYANHDFLAGSKEFESIRNPTIRKNTFCDPSNFNSEIENLFIDYIIVNELEEVFENFVNPKLCDVDENIKIWLLSKINSEKTLEKSEEVLECKEDVGSKVNKDFGYEEGNWETVGSRIWSKEQKRKRVELRVSFKEGEAGFVEVRGEEAREGHKDARDRREGGGKEAEVRCRDRERDERDRENLGQSKERRNERVKRKEKCQFDSNFDFNSHKTIRHNEVSKTRQIICDKLPVDRRPVKVYDHSQVYDVFCNNPKIFKSFDVSDKMASYADVTKKSDEVENIEIFMEPTGDSDFPPLSQFPPLTSPPVKNVEKNNSESLEKGKVSPEKPKNSGKKDPVKKVTNKKTVVKPKAKQPRVPKASVGPLAQKNGSKPKSKPKEEVKVKEPRFQCGECDAVLYSNDDLRFHITAIHLFDAAKVTNSMTLAKKRLKAEKSKEKSLKYDGKGRNDEIKVIDEENIKEAVNEILSNDDEITDEDLKNWLEKSFSTDDEGDIDSDKSEKRKVKKRYGKSRDDSLILVSSEKKKKRVSKVAFDPMTSTQINMGKMLSEAFSTEDDEGEEMEIDDDARTDTTSFFVNTPNNTAYLSVYHSFNNTGGMSEADVIKLQEAFEREKKDTEDECLKLREENTKLADLVETLMSQLDTCKADNLSLQLIQDDLKRQFMELEKDLEEARKSKRNERGGKITGFVDGMVDRGIQVGGIGVGRPDELSKLKSKFEELVVDKEKSDNKLSEKEKEVRDRNEELGKIHEHVKKLEENFFNKLDIAAEIAMNNQDLRSKIDRVENEKKRFQKQIACRTAGCDGRGCDFLHESEVNEKAKTKVICSHYKVGRCKWGAKCYNLHEQPQNQSKLDPESIVKNAKAAVEERKENEFRRSRSSNRRWKKRSASISQVRNDKGKNRDVSEPAPASKRSLSRASTVSSSSSKAQGNEKGQSYGARRGQTNQKAPKINIKNKETLQQEVDSVKEARGSNQMRETVNQRVKKLEEKAGGTVGDSVMSMMSRMISKSVQIEDLASVYRGKKK